MKEKPLCIEDLHGGDIVEFELPWGRTSQKILVKARVLLLVVDSNKSDLVGAEVVADKNGKPRFVDIGGAEHWLNRYLKPVEDATDGAQTETPDSA